MRLDYTLYLLGTLLLIMTVVPFFAPIGVETTETQSLWVISTVVLGLLSFGLGYTQRPKTKAQACQPAVTSTQEMPQTKPAEEEAAKKEKTVAPTIAATMGNMSSTMSLTQVKGIGEKRAKQLINLGINSAEGLSKASAATIAKKLEVSLKIVDNWIANAKELVK